MARKRIREHAAKRLIQKYFPFKKFPAVKLNLRTVLVTENTNWDELKAQNPWLLTEPLVAKPDMMFGKRGKNNLVLLKANIEQAQTFVNDWFKKELTLGPSTGRLTHFIIEPFVPHNEEYYLSFVSQREFDVISFSPAGGIDVEENWDQVKHVEIPTGRKLTPDDFATLGIENLPSPPERKDKLKQFIEGAFLYFQDLDFTLLEMNPFVFAQGPEGETPVPLDFHCELDSTAHFKNRKTWEDIEFPNPFGAHFLPEEEHIKHMDEKSGSSLKLKVLNPKGRIWLMVAGGGASVIYADTVADLGFEQELANYGEYSGGPTEDETYEYAVTILKLATREPDPRGKVLLIGGAIANFTDIAKTFKGIIRALKEYKTALQQTKMKIFVRRAGPNYQAGLELMRKVEKEINVPVTVFGPEKTMTYIVSSAIDCIKNLSS